MQIFGFEITRVGKATPPVNDALVTHVPQRVGSPSWWRSIKESFAGAWQRDITVDRQDVLTYSTVWACVTLIASDIGKLWLKLVEEDAAGIRSEVENPAYSPVLREPNHFQTRVKFFQYWVISLLTTGNTYILKERDGRGVVTGLYVLDPNRVTVLVAPSGDVFYQCGADPLSGVPDVGLTAPAREILHDVCVPLFHPLVGLSPIHACGLSAMQGLKILQNSTRLFANGSQPGGVLSAPAAISEATAKRLEEHWEANYAGEGNIGKIVVLGDGLAYTPMAMTAVDAEVVDQLRMTDERICATFHVPLYMVGLGPAPPYTDIQSLNLQYYAQALQQIIENIESLLDKGLELRPRLHAEFDIDSLGRMDTKTRMQVQKDGVASGIFTPNEARAAFDLVPVEGGDTPYLQQQMFSLAALDARDRDNPAPSTTTPKTAFYVVRSESSAGRDGHTGAARATVVDSVEVGTSPPPFGETVTSPPPSGPAPGVPALLPPLADGSEVCVGCGAIAARHPVECLGPGDPDMATVTEDGDDLIEGVVVGVICARCYADPAHRAVRLKCSFRERGEAA